MSLREAWLVLGRDPDAVAERVNSSPDQVEAAERELEGARTAAKKLMGLHHPDRKGEPESYSMVQEAVRTVEVKTAEFRSSAAERERKKGSAVFIKVEGA